MSIVTDFEVTGTVIGKWSGFQEERNDWKHPCWCSMGIGNETNPRSNTIAIAWSFPDGRCISRPPSYAVSSFTIRNGTRSVTHVGRRWPSGCPLISWRFVNLGSFSPDKHPLKRNRFKRTARTVHPRRAVLWSELSKTAHTGVTFDFFERGWTLRPVID